MCRRYEKTSIDTHYWKKDIAIVLLGLFKIAVSCKSIIMLPAANGVLYFSKIFVAIKRLLGKNIYYDVISSWLPYLTEKTRVLREH